MAPLTITEVEPPRHLIAHADWRTQPAASERYVAVNWAFLLEPQPEGRTRVISRFRSACSDDLASRFGCGPYRTEAIGFVMDRQMLRGLHAREEAERARRALRPDRAIRAAVSTFEDRGRARAAWPVRKVGLRDEALTDARDSSSVDERIALVWLSTRRQREFAGLAVPVYSRATMPGHVLRRARRRRSIPTTS